MGVTFLRVIRPRPSSILATIPAAARTTTKHTLGGTGGGVGGKKSAPVVEGWASRRWSAQKKNRRGKKARKIGWEREGLIRFPKRQNNPESRSASPGRGSGSGKKIPSVPARTSWVAGGVVTERILREGEHNSSKGVFYQFAGPKRDCGGDAQCRRTSSTQRYKRTKGRGKQGRAEKRCLGGWGLPSLFAPAKKTPGPPEKRSDERPIGDRKKGRSLQLGGK